MEIVLLDQCTAWIGSVMPPLPSSLQGPAEKSILVVSVCRMQELPAVSEELETWPDQNNFELFHCSSDMSQ